MQFPDVGHPEMCYTCFMQRQRTAVGEIYHVYNRGVEKRNIFQGENDYFRFIRCLFELNDANPVEKPYIPIQSMDRDSKFRMSDIRNKRKLLVDILAYCLMPNHYHLMIRERIESGIPQFIRKLGTGYTNYFNQKYERVGTLFQGTHKREHLTRDEHFMYLPYYIHLNPLDMVEPAWREGTVSNMHAVFAFLNSYRWSSYLDYTGKKNFPSIINPDILKNILETPAEQKKMIADWISRNGPEDIEHITLE